MYELQTHTFTTPRGHPLNMTYRADTNDWNTIYSAANEDEYRLAGFTLSGIALDVGAHIGSVAISLALDNPHLTVYAIEPLQENVDLLDRNIAANRVGNRVAVIWGAATRHGTKTVRIRYGFRGNEVGTHHAFIGNALLVAPDIESETVEAHGVSIRDLPAADFIKIDCEGAEYDFLDDRNVRHVQTVLGEWHNVDGHTQDDIVDLLGRSHRVSFTGPKAGPGGFLAERR